MLSSNFNTASQDHAHTVQCCGLPIWLLKEIESNENQLVIHSTYRISSSLKWHSYASLPVTSVLKGLSCTD